MKRTVATTGERRKRGANGLTGRDGDAETKRREVDVEGRTATSQIINICIEEEVMLRRSSPCPSLLEH